MKKLIALMLIAFSLTCYGQKSLPDKKETADYIKGKLLTTMQKIKSVEFDENTCILSVKEYCYVGYKFYDSFDYEVQNLNANAMTWDVGEDGDGRFMTLTIAPKNGFKAGSCKYYYRENKVEDANVARFKISIPKAADTPDFQNRIVKAFQRLIELCGGKKEEKDPFEN
jgi:hypothetical protein